MKVWHVMQEEDPYDGGDFSIETYATKEQAELHVALLQEQQRLEDEQQRKFMIDSWRVEEVDVTDGEPRLRSWWLATSRMGIDVATNTTTTREGLCQTWVRQRYQVSVEMPAEMSMEPSVQHFHTQRAPETHTIQCVCIGATEQDARELVERLLAMEIHAWIVKMEAS